jgi:hypothetical protein
MPFALGSKSCNTINIESFECTPTLQESQLVREHLEYLDPSAITALIISDVPDRDCSVHLRGTDVVAELMVFRRRVELAHLLN